MMSTTTNGKGKEMVRLFVFSILLLGVYACAGGTMGTAYTETGAICDVAGMESQLKSIRDRSTSGRLALGVGTPDGGGALGTEQASADVTRVYRVRDRLERLEAETDVHYRNMTQSCNIYARCMEVRGYDEGECRSSLSRWESAQATFASLTRELAEIEAEIDIVRAITRKKRKRRLIQCSEYEPGCDRGGVAY